MAQAPAHTVIRPTRPPALPLWLLISLACAGQFLVVLDVSVVNVALPSLRADLHMSATALQWVVNAYTLTFAGFMLLGGRAGDLFGRKRMFLVGLGLFTFASLAGGLAQEPWQLVTARAVQGMGAAVLAPSTLTLLTASVPEGPARARAIGTWAAVGAGGGATGGLIGGVLTDQLSWRWVLLINVPIGAAVLAGAAFWLAESRSAAGRRLDVAGAVLVTGGLGAVAYGIVQTESAGWGAYEALGPLLGGLAVLAAFVLVEARSPAPLMPMQLFRLRSVSAANTAMFVTGAAMFCSWYFMSLYMQNVLGFSAIETGLGFIPHSLAIVLGSKAAPRLVARTSAKGVAFAGVALSVAGYLWQSGMTADGTYLRTIVGPGVLMMIGAGLATTPLVTVATAGAPASDAGVVSGLVNTARTMGGSVGLSVLSTIAAARIAGGASPAALTSGYALAFRTGTWMLLGAAVLVALVLPGMGRREPKTA